jgi:hypothetical protein
VHGALSMIVWAAILVLLWAERRYALRALPAFGLAPVAALGLAAAAAPEAAVFGSPTAPGLAGHAVLVVLGLGALAVNFAGGLMYLLQERAQARHAGRPVPAAAAARHYRPLLVPRPRGRLLVPDTRHRPRDGLRCPPLRRRLALAADAGWGGRRAAYLAMTGFAGLGATVSVSLLLPTRHVALLGP